MIQAFYKSSENNPRNYQSYVSQIETPSSILVNFFKSNHEAMLVFLTAPCPDFLRAEKKLKKVVNNLRAQILNETKRTFSLGQHFLHVAIFL